MGSRSFDPDSSHSRPGTGEQTSDRALLHRMNAGSTAAFGELYDRHRRQALSVARACSANAANAEEAVQDAFESIWRSRATYRDERGPVLAWAMAIVRYRAMAIDKQRARHVHRTLTDAHEGSTAPGQVADDAEASADSEHLLALLQRIPAAQREVITLAFFGQLSHSEIAEHLDLPAGTVKGRMRLGLNRLRSDIENEGA